MVTVNGNAISALDDLMRSDPLTITGVQDAVALRVNLKPAKEAKVGWTTEPCEGMLCYVQHLIRSKWPALKPTASKTTSSFKSNGYPFYITFVDKFTGNGVSFEVKYGRWMHRLAEFRQRTGITSWGARVIRLLV
jgi:hypothetical protein